MKNNDGHYEKTTTGYWVIHGKIKNRRKAKYGFSSLSSPLAFNLSLVEETCIFTEEGLWETQLENATIFPLSLPPLAEIQISYYIFRVFRD